MPHFNVTAADAGTRLDSFVSKNMPDLSRAFVQKLVAEEKVSVNSAVKRASSRLNESDVVLVSFVPNSIRSAPIDLPILYEDDDCLVINKPAGVLTHSKGAYNAEATVASFVAPRLSDLTGDRAGIVHRLDRGTSGVMIIAKNAKAQAWLQKQFSERKVKKLYEAVIKGHLNPKKAVIDIPIGRHPRKPQTFRANTSGKPAITEYQTLVSSKNYSLVELSPKTGRTHQLRVHLRHLGHPIVGDTLYKGPSAERLYLHAKRLELRLPSKVLKDFSVSTPSEFNGLLDSDG